MIIVTGGAGFIGSVFLWKLNSVSTTDVVIVDRLGKEAKWKNLSKRSFSDILHKDDLFAWLKENKKTIDAVVHMGACSTTTETDVDYLMANNFHYSAQLFSHCADHRIPFLYASSAATYGAAEDRNFDDDPLLLPRLRPLNPYGFSKHLFDTWVLKQQKKPPVWLGFKFFNVYGPNEYHKGAQASVAFHAFDQIAKHGTLRLFKSYREEFPHGGQRRDFIYVKDTAALMLHALKNQTKVRSGIYNLGTGHAASFADLGKAAFQASQKKAEFEWIDMPENIRGQYQYFTEAKMTRLREALQWEGSFMDVTAGVGDYYQHHLLTADPYL